jgi:hypothetical protein
MTSTRDGRRGGRRNRSHPPGNQTSPSYPAGGFVAGQVIEGPAFYVWDEDPRQAREWGVELADAWLAKNPRLPR